MEKIELALERIIKVVLSKVPSLVLAILLLSAGSWIIRIVLRLGIQASLS